MLGQHEHTIDGAAVRSLLAAFDDANFFELDDAYVSRKLPNGQLLWADHGFETTIALTIGGRTKRIETSNALPDVVPEVIVRLERRITKLANADRYVLAPSNGR